MFIRTAPPFNEIERTVVDIQKPKKEVLIENSPNVAKVKNVIGNRADIFAKKALEARKLREGQVAPSPKVAKKDRENGVEEADVLLDKLQSTPKKTRPNLPSPGREFDPIIKIQSTGFKSFAIGSPRNQTAVFGVDGNANLLDNKENEEYITPWLKVLLEEAGPIEDLVKNDILKKQGALGSGDVIRFATPDHEFFITKKTIYILFVKNFLGKGSYSEVFACTAISISDQPIIYKDLVIKRSIASDKATYFTPEKKNLDDVMKFGTVGIDPILKNFKIEGKGYCICRRFDKALDEVEFDQFEDPIAALVSIFLTAAAGLSMIHKSGSIHRDLKPNNLGVIYPKEAEGLPIAVITDWGFLTKKKNDFHRTLGTLDYLDPGQFYTADQIQLADRMKFNLLNQKQRIGIQTEAGDNYAFGRTMEESLMTLLIKLGGIEAENVLKQIRPLYCRLEDDCDQQLLDLGPESNFRLIYYQNNKGDNRLMILPELHLVRQKLLEACNGLQNLETHEKEALSQLCHLSCDLQGLDFRPRIKNVQGQLQQILETLVPNLTPFKSPLRDIARPEKDMNSKKSLHNAFEEEDRDSQEVVSESITTTQPQMSEVDN